MRYDGCNTGGMRGLMAGIVICTALPACAIDGEEVPTQLPGHDMPGKEDAPNPAAWWIGASVDASAAQQNSGVRTTFTVVDKAPEAGCFGAWTSETLDNGLWAQVGYASCNTNGTHLFSGFYQVYSGSFELVDGEIPMTEGLHSFSMAQTSGTFWTFAFDGAPFGAFDMGTASADGTYAQTVIEETDAHVAYPPPATKFPEVISWLHDGVWTRPAKAVVYNNTGVQGANGRDQDATMAVDEMEVSGSVSRAPAGTELWQAPATPSTFTPVSVSAHLPYVALVAPTGTGTLSGTVTLNANASAPSGIASVVFWVGHHQQPTCTLHKPPFTCAFDTTTVGNGSPWVTVVATGKAGQTTSEAYRVNVHNPAP